MNTFERALIEPSLIRTLMRGDQTALAMTEYIDPFALVVGMTFWGSRVYGIRAQRIKLSKQGYATPPPNEPQGQPQTEQMTVNGYSTDMDLQNVIYGTTDR